MNFRENERQRAIALRDRILHDPGSGMFFGKERDFVLKDPSLNLWEGIREDAKDYFKSNHIVWWGGDAEDPTGHMLSSQVACLNHLYFMRRRQDVATAVLKAIQPDVEESVFIDNGYVEFEFIGSKPYLKEKGFTRGANCTSMDAVMCGRNKAGVRTAFLIEWKYTEVYQPECKYIPERQAVYDHLITAADSPFVAVNPRDLYYEPFYQMMRQTLLGWQWAKAKEYGFDDYIHVHVIPGENLELRNRITSPGLSGATITEAWQKILKDPAKYRTMTPEALLQPAATCPETKSALEYLNNRYWQ